MINWLALAVLVGISLMIVYFTKRYYDAEDEAWERYVEEYWKRREEGKE